MMYFRFILCLAFGLSGVTLFLTAMMDMFFLDWSFSDRFQAFIASTDRPGRYVQVYDIEAETARVRSRLIPVTKNKELAAEMIFPGLWVQPPPAPPPVPLAAPLAEYLV
jgi:hypothetical protein